MSGSSEAEYTWKSAWGTKELTLEKKVDVLECLKLMEHAIVVSASAGTR